MQFFKQGEQGEIFDVRTGSSTGFVEGLIFKALVYRFFKKELKTSYNFLEFRADMWVGLDEKKEIDLLFSPKSEIDLDCFSKTAIGNQIRMLGQFTLGSPKLIDASKDSLMIPSNAIVFSEVKTANNHLNEALQQQMMKISQFIKWLKSEMWVSLFMSSQNHQNLNSDIVATIKKCKEAKVVEVVGLVVWGQDDELDQHKREDLEEAFRDSCLYKDFHNEKAVRIGELEVKIRIILIYIPNYVSNHYWNKVVENATSNKREEEFQKKVIEE